MYTAFGVACDVLLHVLYNVVTDFAFAACQQTSWE